MPLPNSEFDDDHKRSVGHATSVTSLIIKTVAWQPDLLENRGQTSRAFEVEFHEPIIS